MIWLQIAAIANFMSIVGIVLWLLFTNCEVEDYRRRVRILESQIDLLRRFALTKADKVKVDDLWKTIEKVR